jgi:predicted dehydrogenase
VIGAGSIGRRHLRNLNAVGISKLYVFDSDPARVSAAVSEIPAQGAASLDAALARGATAVFVCTPPVLHVELARKALLAGCHVFIEKPLSHSLDGVAELAAIAERSGHVVQVGYNLRWHPGLVKLKELLDQGEIGRVLWARVEVGQYLPDWHPGTDYRQSYTASKTLGGGIILDASHELDYILWLLGEPTEVKCMAGKVSRLETDVEDCATILLRFQSGAQADVHLDFVQRGYSRNCKLAGERGTLLWDFSSNQVSLFRADSGKWEQFPYEFETNDMYVAEASSFLQSVANGGSAAVTLQEATRVLQVALAAKRGV